MEHALTRSICGPAQRHALFEDELPLTRSMSFQVPGSGPARGYIPAVQVRACLGDDFRFRGGVAVLAGADFVLRVNRNGEAHYSGQHHGRCRPFGSSDVICVSPSIHLCPEPETPNPKKDVICVSPGIHLC